MAFLDFLPIIGDAVNAVSQSVTNAQNAKENEKNRQWSEHMWHLNNQYNLPVNQIQRFKDAGLNPALAYGQGTSSLSSYSGNQQANRSFEAPKLQMMAEVKRLQNETKVAESTEEMNEAQAYKATAEGNRISTENERLPERIENELKILGFEAHIKELEDFVKERTYNDEIQIIVENMQQEVLETDISVERKKEIIQRVTNLAEEYNNLVKQGKVLEAEKLLKDEMRNTEKSQQTKNLADAYYSKVKASVVPSEIALNRANARKAIADAIKANSDVQRNDAEIVKAANDIEEQLYKGNTERALSIAQIYGSSVIGSIERNFTDVGGKARSKAVTVSQRKKPVKSKSYFKR